MKKILLCACCVLPITTLPVVITSCSKKIDYIAFDDRCAKERKSFIGVDDKTTTRTIETFILKNNLKDGEILTATCNVTSGNFRVEKVDTVVTGNSISITINFKSTKQQFAEGDKCLYSLTFNSNKGSIKKRQFDGFSLEMLGDAPTIETITNNVTGTGKTTGQSIQIINLFKLSSFPEGFMGLFTLEKGFVATITDDETITVDDGIGAISESDGTIKLSGTSSKMSHDAGDAIYTLDLSDIESFNFQCAPATDTSINNFNIASKPGASFTSIDIKITYS